MWFGRRAKFNHILEVCEFCVCIFLEVYWKRNHSVTSWKFHEHSKRILLLIIKFVIVQSICRYLVWTNSKYEESFLIHLDHRWILYNIFDNKKVPIKISEENHYVPFFFISHLSLLFWIAIVDDMLMVPKTSYVSNIDCIFYILVQWIDRNERSDWDAKLFFLKWPFVF